MGAPMSPARTRARGGDELTAYMVSWAVTLGAVALTLVYAYPVLALVPVGMVAVGLTRPAPVTTGVRGAPATPTEQAALEAHQVARRIGTCVATGLLTTTTALPGAIGVGLLAAALRVHAPQGYEVLAQWGWVGNGVGVALAAGGLARYLRACADPAEPSPGVGLRPSLLRRPLLWAVSLPAAGLASAGAWMVERTWPWTMHRPALAVAGAALATWACAAWMVGRRSALEQWRGRHEARSAWRSRWSLLPKMEPAPALVGHEMVGPYTVDTCDCPPGRGAAEFIALAPKIATTIGAGSQVSVLTVPGVDPSGAPLPGTTHPTRFAVATLPAGTSVDVCDPGTSEQVASLAFRCAVATWAATFKTEQVPLTGVECLTVDGSRRVWAVTGAGDVSDALAGLAPVLPDEDRVLVGDTENAQWVDEQMVEATRLGRIGAQWADHLKQVIRQGQTLPVPQTRFMDTWQVDGATVNRLIFSVPQGLDIEREYLGLAQRLKTTMPSAPFLTVLAMAPTEGGGEPGARSDKFFVIAWSTSPVPATPEAVSRPRRSRPSFFDPRDGATMVLAGMVDTAFRTIFGAKGAPQTVAAQCLTHTGPSIWRVQVRLYGGVSVADLRAKADRLRSALGCAWLRVRPAGLTVDLFMGAAPAAVERVDMEVERTLAELDFEQAWADAKVANAFGEVPTMTDAAHLAGNEAVSVFTFALPAGLAVQDVSDAQARLAASTGNGFLQVVAQPNPSLVQVLASPTNPIPTSVAYDFALTDRLVAAGCGEHVRAPWGVGVDGGPVMWDTKDTPHVLAAGMTGAGKSVTLQTVIYATILGGWEVLVIDPSKGGVDFACFAPYLRGLIGDVPGAEAALKAVYAQVGERKALAGRYGVGGVADLPADVRPAHVLVVIDEFTSLLLPEPVKRFKTTDPSVLEEWERAETLNSSKASIASLVGRIGREARSAGVHLLLGTQQLKADTLKAVPGGDLKANLGRLALGKMTWGELASALRSPDAAPRLTECPKGRGIWESMSTTGVQMQTFYATQDQYRQALAEREVPTKEDWDYTRWLPEVSQTVYGEVEPQMLDPLDLGEISL